MRVKVVTFKVSEELLKEFDRVALQQGLCRSEAIRRAIRYYIIRVREDGGEKPKVKLRRVVLA